MTEDTHNPHLSPEPLPLLLNTLPAGVVLQVLKADDALLKSVLQGFQARAGSLALAPVRQRLEREIARHPRLAESLLERWLEVHGKLMRQVNEPDYAPSDESLRTLMTAHGTETVRYGLLHAEREEVRAWAERLPASTAAPSPPSAVEQTTPVAGEDLAAMVAQLRREMAGLHQQQQIVETDHQALKRDLTTVRQQLQTAAEREAALQKQFTANEVRLEREQRRARKAEEESEGLRKRLRKLEEQAAATPEVPASPVPAEVSALLLRALELLGAPVTTAKPAPPPAPPVASPVPPAPDKRNVGPTFSLPNTRGKALTFSVPQVLKALVQNDEALIGKLRDGLSRLAKTPAKERMLVGELVKAGIPQALLTGPLRPAVIDGSNVANMSPSSRGRVAYLEQVRRAAWEEGYFPVIVIVDASLRHHIDQPDRLMEMVEDGEIRMAPPGTSADVQLIEEAAQRQADLLTNDRMTDWPAAKTLEKRHLTIERNTIRIGDFHRSSRWFG